MISCSRFVSFPHSNFCCDYSSVISLPLFIQSFNDAMSCNNLTYKHHMHANSASVYKLNNLHHYNGVWGGCGLHTNMYDTRLHIQHSKSGSIQKLATTEAHSLDSNLKLVSWIFSIFLLCLCCATGSSLITFLCIKMFWESKNFNPDFSENYARKTIRKSCEWWQLVQETSGTQN